jgi:2,4-dienoyl-CoA reductase-like NADH-dependent reductase (Old Yellow Enzyme family)
VSDEPYDEHTSVPKAMTLEDIETFKQQFVSATKRALKAGFDVCHCFYSLDYADTL